ncbi:nicotinate-nucleotide--dimethylbenzimidazole phosphoribosyltransferase [Teredinibacter purpureus]|jgi:nicotinate-nucleotide--dimethylbenzimidazole phosphoribosyltransferase|uniref:nicotinate-nucleotide--dimethylbenzimidazole phosphoribosyltransferase n=1 Tax=Teredinibacter purpureus TaxID=2731756 RepID=UPI0005F87095|nr:nicotinate-nucleotide--dimethylbenzimidazole phosphoribosyltransferase [Teredinibacter purpureus]
MNTASALQWLSHPLATIDQAIIAAAKQHQLTLTKPPGSLGKLETIALQFAGWQGNVLPTLSRICVRVFAGDHGICAHNISAFPQSVTAQMIDNFVTGGAAINILSQQINADFGIRNMGTAYSPTHLNPAFDLSIGPGTLDSATTEAMSKTQLYAALNAGRSVIVEAQKQQQPQLFIGGEMGIGNTSSASLLYALLLQYPLKELTGPGTGLDNAGLQHKQLILQQALQLHQPTVAASDHKGLSALSCCGGFEIAALTGAYLTAAQQGIPIVIDGFIATAALLIAHSINPDILRWSLFSHCSAEPAHTLALEYFGVTPLLQLDMRLGEGSGAAMAVPLLQNALALHSQMATFTGAGIDESVR